MIPYILTEKSLTVVIDGKAHTMNNDHPAWHQAKDALAQEEWKRLESLFDVAQAVEDYLDNEAQVEISEGLVRYKGEAVHNVVVDKLMSFMRQGITNKPLIKFLGKLMENPSRRAINELYSFLEHKGMPLTPEGNFIAYKGVTSEFRDKYTGKFDNSVGQVLEMARNGVCDDANIGCSDGFHAGSLDYARGWASDGGYVMRVEINPADVVSVPHDCECQKLRTSKYKVVAIHENVERQLDEGIYGDWDEDSDDGWATEGELSEARAEGYDEGYQAAIDNAINLKNN